MHISKVHMSFVWMVHTKTSYKYKMQKCESTKVSKIFIKCERYAKVTLTLAVYPATSPAP